MDAEGPPIEVVDRLTDGLVPLAFVSRCALFGDLVGDGRLATAYRSTLDLLHTKGPADARGP